MRKNCNYGWRQTLSSHFGDHFVIYTNMKSLHLKLMSLSIIAQLKITSPQFLHMQIKAKVSNICYFLQGKKLRKLDKRSTYLSGESKL